MCATATALRDVLVVLLTYIHWLILF